ncbi:MAG: hypothetical protein QOI85_119, partial [Chloroflexota bacterium]|jgi:hypothetical protein|nr:hypothetical protein [Chloroflexota bacterium]
MTPGASASPDPLVFVRWLDVGLLIVTVPVLLLAGLPELGVLVGAGAWVLNRVVGAVIESRAHRAQSFKTQTGLLLASTMGRAWLAGLTILAAGLAGEREDGLTAAILVLAAFTVYFVLSLILRPERKSERP